MLRSENKIVKISLIAIILIGMMGIHAIAFTKKPIKVAKSMGVTPNPLIKSIQDITIEVKHKDFFKLPNYVSATMSSGVVKKVKITWNTNKVDTNKIGIFNYKGMVKGYAKAVKLSLMIVPSILTIDNIEATLKQGDSYVVPSTVIGKMSDDNLKQVPVIWDVNAVDTSKVGYIECIGKVKEYPNEIKLKLNIISKIMPIEDINVTIKQYDKYKLPLEISVKMSDNTIRNMTVLWKKSIIDTNIVGVDKYTGKIEGYEGVINLKLTIEERDIKFDQNSKGSGFLEGAYDKFAIQPSTNDWCRQSKLGSIKNPRIKWKLVTDESEENSLNDSLLINTREFSSPVIDSEGTIYVMDYPFENRINGYLYAVNKDGTLNWKLELGKSEGSIVIGFNGNLYACGTITDKAGIKNSYLYSIFKNGQINWKKVLDKKDICCPPVLDSEGLIYVGTQNGVQCYDLEGKLIWNYKSEIELVEFKQPVLDNFGNLYVISKGMLPIENKDRTYIPESIQVTKFMYGVLVRLERRTGVLLSYKKLDIFPDYYSVSISANGNIIVPSKALKIYSRDLSNTINIVDDLTEVKPNFSDNLWGYVPVISNEGNMTFTSKVGYIFSVDKNGKLLWLNYDLIKNGKSIKTITTPPIQTSDGYLYYCTSEVTAKFKPAIMCSNNDKIKWSFNLPIDCNPKEITVGDDGVIYLTSYEKNSKGKIITVLYAIEEDI